MVARGCAETVLIACILIARPVCGSPVATGVRPEAAAAASVEGWGRDGSSRGDADVLLRLVDLCSVYPQDCADDAILRFAVRVGSPPSDARRLSRVLGFCRTRRGRCEQLAEVSLSPSAYAALTGGVSGAGANGASSAQGLSVDEQKIVGYLKVLAEGHGRSDYLGTRRKRNVHPLYIRLFREFCRSYSWRCGPPSTSTTRPQIADA